MHCLFPNCDYDAGRADLQEIALHKFPEAPFLRMAWLEALDMPDSVDLEEGSAVCSKHFLTDDFIITRTGQTLRSDAVPIDHVQVCRICFNKNSKLYPMKNDMQLDLCRASYAEAYETLTGIEIEQKDMLPSYLCIKCAKQLLSCVRFKAKCIQAYSILKDIVNDYGYITLESVESVTNIENHFSLDLMHNQTYSENVESENTYADDLKEESITYEGIKTESIDIIDHGILITDVRSTNDKEHATNLGTSNSEATKNNDITLWSSTPRQCESLLDYHVKSESNNVIHQYNVHREPNEDNVRENLHQRNVKRLQKDKDIRGLQTVKDIRFFRRSLKDKAIRGSQKDKVIKNLHEDMRILRKDQNITRSLRCKYIRGSHENIDNKRLYKDTDFNGSHKNKDISRSHKKRNISGSHKERDISGSRKERDISWSHERDISGSHERHISGSRNERDISGSHENTDISGSYKERDISGSHERHISGLRKKRDINKSPKDNITESIVDNNNTDDISSGEDSGLNVSLPIEKTRPKHKPCLRNEKNILRPSKDDNRERQNREKGNCGLLLSYKLLSCDVCGYQTLSNVQLLRHLEDHVSIKMYNCIKCDFLTNCKKKLQFHFATHCDLKSHSCNICDKTFTYKGDLKSHLRIHSREKPYSCDICNKKFIQHSQLKVHLRVHSGEKPYTCDLCNKAFKQKGQLQNHIRIHTGDKPYSCDLCSKAFVQRGQLQTHLLTHSREKPYS